MSRSLWYTIPSFILLIILLFKPATVYTLETYLSSLLKTEVEIVYLHLFDLDAQATIKTKNNIAKVKVNSLYPFQADIVYSGNIDAFKVYHPIKAEALLKGHLYYKEMLQLDAKLEALGAKADVKVNENADGWDVLVDLQGLNLQQLKDENNLSVEISGVIDGNLDFHTAKDSTIKVSSDRISLKGQVVKDFELQVSRADENIYAWALFNAEGIEYKGVWFHYDQNTSSFKGKADLVHKAYKKALIVDLNGEHKDSKLLAQAGIGIEGSRIDIKDIVYDMNSNEMHADVNIALKALEQHRYLSALSDVYLYGDLMAKVKLDYKDKILKADVEMQSLGGNLKLDYRDDVLQWQLQGVELSKLLSLLGKEAVYEAKINTQGSIRKDTIKAEVNTKSLQIAESEIKNIHVDVEGTANDLESVLRLETPYASVDKAKIRLKDLERLSLEAEVMTPYISKDISVKANVVGLKGESSLELNATSKEFALLMPHAKYSDSKLDGTYKAFIEPELSRLKKSLAFDGSFSYDKVLKVEMINRDMVGVLQAFLTGRDIKLKGSDLSLEKLLNHLDQPTYAKGNFDLDAQGSLQEMTFTLKTKRLALLKEETGLDENLSGEIKGSLSKEKLIVWPDIKNRYLDTSKGQVVLQFSDKTVKLDMPFTLKQEKHSLDMFSTADINFEEGVRADISLRHKDDRIHLNNLSYREKKLQTDIDIDIKELHNYKAISPEELYGALKMSGKATYEQKKPELVLNSASLGGRLDLSLKEDTLTIDLKRLSAARIGTLLHKEGGVKKGYLNGNVYYDLEKRSGSTKLDAKELRVQGIDIDGELKGLEDVLGLNIFAMGSTLYGKSFKGDDLDVNTEIRHMKLDVDITPDLILSKDVAMSTNSYRFAVNTSLRHDGTIKDFEIAVLDRQGCAILRQRLKGNISSPELVNSTGTAVVLLGNAPKSVLKTGGKVLDFGASVIDSSANFIWQKALRQESNITLINDTMTRGFNVLSAGKEMIVSGQCEVFYSGEVKHPQ